MTAWTHGLHQMLCFLWDALKDFHYSSVWVYSWGGCGSADWAGQPLKVVGLIPVCSSLQPNTIGQDINPKLLSYASSRECERYIESTKKKSIEREIEHACVNEARLKQSALSAE